MRSYIFLALAFFFALVSAQAQPDVDDVDDVEIAGGKGFNNLKGFNKGNNNFKNGNVVKNTGRANNRVKQQTDTKADLKTDKNYATNNVNRNHKDSQNTNFGTGFNKKGGIGGFKKGGGKW
ncbi:hypothetical protein HK097_006639 [Rhizophlyctis rosea]|uniref:Uncharacterized protein n=1 Tax=Rhizophlyctis rosea TaxID=64517 RepID=A0AAD5SFQ6_9FUNG|nr:hypothetical protein HK097_006639 [Rhizophlyctis rosea]